MMFRNFIKKIVKDKRMYLPVLEMHIVDHCNLKCKGCSHFSNIADEYYVSVEDFRNSLLLASKHFRIHSFALMGGEPFLHPEIKQLIGEARKILPSARIVISSNGMLVDKLGDDVWGELIKNEVFINVSKYPVNSPYFSDILDKIIETIRQRSIMEDKVNTLTAQGKFESIVMACAPLMAFIILYLLDRQLMEPLVTTVLGWAAIFVVLVLETIGYLFIKKIVTVEI